MFIDRTGAKASWSEYHGRKSKAVYSVVVEQVPPFTPSPPCLLQPPNTANHRSSTHSPSRSVGGLPADPIVLVRDAPVPARPSLRSRSEAPQAELPWPVVEVAALCTPHQSRPNPRLAVSG